VALGVIMLKKILRYLGGILLIVFTYFNYIKEPEIIEKKENDTLVTTGVTYEVENYYVEAEKQIDDNKNKKRTFEKARALFDGMDLSGDNALVDSTNNLFLENNILGIAKNGWKLEAKKAKYIQTEEKIYATNQVKAYNEEEGITLYGNSLETDTKLEDLNLEDDIRVVTDKMQLSANYVHYSDKTKIMNIKENISIRGRKLGALETDEISGHLTEATYDGIKKTIHGVGDFVIYYKGSNLRAKDFTYDEISGDFTISKDVVVEFQGGSLNVEKINYVAKENKMYFVGPIRGKQGEFKLEADTGVYDSTIGNLELKGNLKIYNKTSKLLADNGTYNTQTGDLYMSSKTLVKYKDLEREMTTKDFTYNNKTGKLKLLNNYTYISATYSSTGKELYYDETTEIGKIIEGTFKGESIDGSANIVDFDLSKKLYNFIGNAKATYDGSTLKSQRIDIDDLNKLATIDGSYTIHNLEDKMTFYGQNAKYNMATGDLSSKGKVKAIKEDKTMTGLNLTYNSNTGLGKLERDIILVDEIGTKMTGDTMNFNSNSYVEIIGNLKIKTNDAVLTAHSGKYDLAKEVINIPGEINIDSENGNATMNDGVYYTKEERMTAKNFVGVSGDKRARGNEVNYFVSREVAQLNGDVEIENPTMKFTGTQGEYSFITEDVSSDEKYKIYYENYIIYGETIKGNMKSEILDGTKVNLISSQGEKLYGDFMFGDLKNKQIDLDGNVKALAFNVDKKTKKKDPVKIRGDTAKIFLVKDENGELTISRAEIKKNGIYEYQEMTLYSDYIELDLIKKLALGRHGSHLNLEGRTDVKAEILDINMVTEVAILINDVDFKNVDEEGKVTVATSDKGRILNKEQIAILRENVVADTAENHIEADYTEYHMETGILKAKGNVRLDYK
jgi:lipopolysaccharide export system protein LptA